MVYEKTNESVNIILNSKSTVADLIKVLNTLDQDAEISYDYGLQISITDYDGGYTIC